MTMKYGIPWTENVHLIRSITADEVMPVIGTASIHFEYGWSAKIWLELLVYFERTQA